MTVTVGTDVFDTVANVDTYWSDRGNTAWAALDTSTKEVHMRKATDWISRNFRFIGTRKTATQRLHWPANDAVDPDGFTVGEQGAPWQVKEAMAIIADLVREGAYDLEGILTDDTAAIKKQKVDVIEVEYDTAARLRGQDVISHVYQILAPLTFSSTLLRA